MKQYAEQLEIQKRKLEKALKHLEYSYQKVCKISDNVEELDEESLASWESFSAHACLISNNY